MTQSSQFLRVKMCFIISLIASSFLSFSSLQAKYQGRLTCDNLEHLRVHTNDTRFIPFCNDTSKACFIREKIEKLASAHPLRVEFESKLEDYLSFQMGMCEAAIMAYAPQLYKEELER